MRNEYIRIIGDDLWFQGMKIATLHPSGIPSVDAAVRVHLSKTLADAPVGKWPSS